MKDDAKFLKSLIEVAHIEFQSYDFYHRHLICSSGVARKFLGYSKEEFYQFSNNFYEALIHPDDRQKMNESIDKIIRSAEGEVVETTARLRRADGNYIWIYTRKMVSERNSDGSPSIITTVAEDVTDFIRMQEQLAEKVSQLQAISYRNSHLLRGPVSSIIGLISNLIEEKSITNQHNLQVFNFLKEAIQKLDEVIYEINDIAKT